MKYERTTKVNERMARLEREALRLGVGLEAPTKNSRTFKLSKHRSIVFKPKGKGTMIIEARHSGVLEATTVARDDKIKELLRKAAEQNGSG